MYTFNLTFSEGWGVLGSAFSVFWLGFGSGLFRGSITGTFGSFPGLRGLVSESTFFSSSESSFEFLFLASHF